MPETPDVHIEEIGMGPKPIEGVSTSTVGFVGLTTMGEEDEPTLVTGWKDFVTSFGRYDEKKAPFLPPAVYGFFANGGRRCYVVKVRDDTSLVGADRGPGKRTGLNSLIDIDEVSIICLPGAVDKGVQKEILKQCKLLKYRFCIFDVGESADIAVAKKHRDDVVSADGYAALYYPWIKALYETVDDTGKVVLKQDRFFPPSGYMAGVYARSDMEKGVHKAPANEILRDVSELKFSVNSEEQSILNSAGVNCIRKLPGREIRVWGARTISDDTDWKYVNVRRLVIYLEKSIERGIQWVVFEPNDTSLWTRVKQSITQFLLTAWRNRCFMGATQDEAFFVKCDRSTMTDNDISNGRLICIIGVALMRPAEFVIIRIMQRTSSAKS